MGGVSQARCRLPQPLDGLLTSEMSRAIEEANLGSTDAQIAKRYLVDRIPQIDIAIEFGYERSTISKRMKNIVPRVSASASRVSIPQ